METKIFLNLPVKDLNKSKAFFIELGYSFNEKFSNDKGAGLVISSTINVMLLTEEFYKTFTNKEISNASTTSEVIISLSVANRNSVDEIIGKVIKAGGKEYMEAKDYGWMYHRSFLDLDAHHWEIFFMDESQMPTS